MSVKKVIMGINQIYFQRVWTEERRKRKKVVWSQYVCWRCINALDQIAWVKIMKKWNYIDIEKNWFFRSLLLSTYTIHCCHTYITRMLARGDEVEKGKFMYAINVLIWATRHISQSFYFARYMLQFSVESEMLIKGRCKECYKEIIELDSFKCFCSSRSRFLMTQRPTEP